MKLTDNSLIINSNEVKLTKNEVLSLISNAISNKYKISETSVLKALKARESSISTGIGDGIAIPHAQIDIKDPQVVVIRTRKTSVNWKSIDNQPVDLIVSILVPKVLDDTNELHFKILTSLSKKTLDPEFVNLLRTAPKEKVISGINSINISSENVVTSKTNKSSKKGTIKIVGVTSCATGIAHTYMAAEAIEKAAKAKGYEVKIEKRGAMGVENKLSDSDIKNADYAIIASEINIDPSIFVGKKTYISSAGKAIKEKDFLETAIAEATMIEGSPMGKSTNQSTVVGIEKTSNKSKFRQLLDHMLFGVSWMLPLVVVSGILLGLVNIITSIVFVPGGDWSLWDGHWFMSALVIFGQVGFGLMFGVFSAAMAYSIGGKPAVSVGFISGMLITNSAFIFVGFENFGPLGDISDKGIHAGFFGAIFTGWFSGWIVNQLQKLKLNSILRPLMPILIIPLFVSLFMAMVIKFIIGIPLSFLMYGLFIGLEAMSSAGAGVIWMVGFVFGAAAMFDLGGPINKTAFAVSLGLFFGDTGFTEIWQPYSAFHVAIPIASIGALFAYLIKPNLWPESMKVESTTAAAMGWFGISEGAIPIAISNPKVWIPANMLGGGVAGALIVLLGVRVYGGVAGPFMMFLGAMDSASFANWSVFLIWPIVTAIGALVTAFTAIGLAKYEIKKNNRKLNEEDGITVKDEKKKGFFNNIQIGSDKGNKRANILISEQELTHISFKTINKFEYQKS